MSTSYRNRVRGLAELPRDRVLPAPKNWRTHDDAQRGLMRSLLGEVGVIGAVHAWIPDDHGRDALRSSSDFGAWLASYSGPVCLFDGHMRREEIRQKIPVLITDLDESEAEKALATFDPIGARAGKDAALLADLIGGIVAAEKGTADFLADLLGTRPTSGDDENEQPDDAPPASKIGESYSLGAHLLTCGDSTDRAVVSAALAGSEPKLWIFDPPFDVEYTSWQLLPSVDVVGVWFRNKTALTWMADTFRSAEWGPHTLVFTGGVRGQHNHTLPCCMHENVTVWRRTWWTDKMHAIDRTAIEASGCKATKDGRPISWQEKIGGVMTGAAIGMSWAKPTIESEILMAYVPRGSAVWDPCAGSGSSLISAEKHGRVWRGVESSPLWCDLIRRRWSKWAAANGRDPGVGALAPAETKKGSRRRPRDE